eukprot:gene43213-52825_t
MLLACLLFLLLQVFFCSHAFFVPGRASTSVRSALYAQEVQIEGRSVTADLLRGLELTNSLGETQTIGSLAGPDKSIVLFLRHLDEWMDLLPQLRAKNISGPVLVSVGNVDKVDLFLEKNSRVPRELLLLDTGLQAYKQVGFGKIGQNPQRAAAGAKNMQMPKGF